MAYYMVRAQGQTKEVFEYLFSRNVVAVGWSDFDFSSHSDVEQLVSEYRNTAPAYRPALLTKYCNEIRRFMALRRDDHVLVPVYESIALAVVEGTKLYDRSVAETLDLSNQVRVVFERTSHGQIAKIPRTQLSNGLQTRLRAPGTTIIDLQEWAAELEALFAQGTSFDYSTSFQDFENAAFVSMRNTLLSSIRNRSTRLQAGGQGLERLVAELLEADGYKADVLPKNLLGGASGDVDIRATRADRFSQTRLMVQVKHHEGETDQFAAEQLIKARASTPEFQDFTAIVITSAQASAQLRKACDENEIIVIDGDGLVSWIIDDLDKLSVGTKQNLGISKVPQLVSVFRNAADA